MEQTIIAIGAKLWIFLKFVAPAAFGSAIAVFSDKAERTKTYTIGMFTAGLLTSIYGGGGTISFIEWYLSKPELKIIVIVPNQIQAAIYFTLGLWGLGLAIQLKEKLPDAVLDSIKSWTVKK